MTKDKQQAAIESNASFGPIEFDYYPVGAGGEWFAKWLPGYPAPSQGYKIHVSARLEDAEIVARAVLPVLRRLRVALRWSGTWIVTGDRSPRRSGASSSRSTPRTLPMRNGC